MFFFFFSSRRRQTRCALVTGVQTCALPIYAFPWIERDIGIDFDDRWGMPKVDEATMRSTHPKVFFGGDAAFGPKNLIWAVAHGHEAAVSIHASLEGGYPAVRPAPMLAIVRQTMRIHEWSYDTHIAHHTRPKGTP